MSEGTTVAERADTPTVPDLSTWWPRQVPWWHVAFAANLVVASAVMLAEHATGLVFVPVALLALGYAARGAAALRRDDRGRAISYLAAATPLLAVAVYLHPAAMLLLLSLYPQCFAMLERFRWSALAAGVLTLATSVALAWRDGWTAEATLAAGLTGLVNLTVALSLGLFVGSIVRESDRRAGLIAALSTAQSELAVAHHQAGVLAERERLAREIHDTLAQGFTSIVMLARAIDAGLARSAEGAGGGDRATGGPAELREKIALLEETAQANLAEARALVAATPPDLSEAGLVAAVRRAADRCARESGASCDVTVEGTPTALGGPRDVVLLRVAQEALANVVKHAAATHVRVRLEYDDTGTALAVDDDGRGFELEAASGFGLAGMRHRVEQAGGSLCVESSRGGGTRLRVVLP